MKNTLMKEEDKFGRILFQIIKYIYIRKVEKGKSIEMRKNENHEEKKL